MNIGSRPVLYRGAVAPAVYGQFGTYSIDSNAVSVTTPEADLMSVTIPTALFRKEGDSIEIEGWLTLSGGHTLYLYVDGSSFATLTVGGAVGMRHKFTIVKTASGYVTGNSRQYLGNAQFGINSFTPAGSSFVVKYRGTDVTQSLLRVIACPI